MLKVLQLQFSITVVKAAYNLISNSCSEADVNRFEEIVSELNLYFPHWTSCLKTSVFCHIILALGLEIKTVTFKGWGLIACLRLLRIGVYICLLIHVFLVLLPGVSRNSEVDKGERP